MDYKTLTDTATFPAGSTKAKIKVKPLPAKGDTDNVKVEVKLLSGTDYPLGTPSNATIKIVSDQQNKAHGIPARPPATWRGSLIKA